VLTKYQESFDNIIEFPEDPPEAFEVIIMMMYGYTCASARRKCVHDKSLDLEWPGRKLPQAYDLATKYQLPSIESDLLDYLNMVICKNQTMLTSTEWFWSILTWLYDNDDSAPEMRTALRAALRENPDIVEGRKEAVREWLLGCPKLAAELAMNGGFAGN